MADHEDFEEDEYFEEIDEEPEREHRITMEIIVDSYNAEEQAMGWQAYLSTHMHFPFTASCIKRSETSPLEPGEKVTVVGMASEETCMHEMFVLIKWKNRKLAVPLIQLEGVDVDKETQQGIEDWHYWVKRGYGF